MGLIVGFLKKAALEAKMLPKAVWVAAVILPFGLFAVGTWITGKSIYDDRKKVKKV